ncbi:glycosyltransferase family 2 protein [Novosphingobium rosa]|uniref:glycosyltransferase family 2 protein n=1 Tax=Novosphingobium rosa TaxID=76978 RepID=UPI00082D21B8|nr:glycosyltransferase family A protein [Novosphingobium rosa]
MDTTAPHFSVIIANFNYGRFVGRAIESALDLDWPHIEVIVVDDGSSDESRPVIEGFGTRIKAIFQPNSGQRAANNAGFAASHGDIVVFLDADDILDPHFARAVASVWRKGVSKVQVQMQRVDAQERSLGSILPALAQAPAPDEVRRWSVEMTEYPTPPGSGNAYARDFLELFFPIGPEHDSSTDSTCLALAPLLGDVVTVLQPLVLYRQHGENDSNLFASPGRFGREVARAMSRQRSAESICDALGTPPPDKARLRSSRHLLQLRVASLRMDPSGHPLPEDNRRVALIDALHSVTRRGFDPLSKRLVVALWSIATLTAPRPLANRLVRWRFRAAP